MVELALRAVGAHIAFMLALVPALVAFGAFSLPLFYVLSLVGFLAVYELVSPLTVQTRWKRRLTYVAVVWLAGFGVLAGWQLFGIVSTAV